MKGARVIRLGDIWDRTTEVLRERGRLLAAIAVLLAFLPGLIENALANFADPRAVALIALLLMLAGIVLALWANLSLVAAADPAGATRLRPVLAFAAPRVPLFLGLALLISAVVAVVMIVAMVILLAGIVDTAALRHPDPNNPLAAFHAPSAGGVVLWIVLIPALIALFLWGGARLLPLPPVILHERRGFGSLGRSFALTRGLALRLMGFLLLAGVTLAVTALGVQLIVGLSARLLLGAGQLNAARFIAQLAVGLVSAAFTVVMMAFIAQLYRALTGTRAAQTFA